MTEMTVTLPEPTSSSRMMPAAIWDVALGGPQVPAWPAVIAGAGSVELPIINEDQAELTADQAEAFALALLAAAEFSRRCDDQASRARLAAGHQTPTADRASRHA
jgi:hypothetical protein